LDTHRKWAEAESADVLPQPAEIRVREADLHPVSRVLTVLVAHASHGRPDRRGEILAIDLDANVGCVSWISRHGYCISSPVSGSWTGRRGIKSSMPTVSTLGSSIPLRRPIGRHRSGFS